MKKVFILTTGATVYVLKDMGELVQILHNNGEDDGLVETVSKSMIVEQAELCNVQAPTVQDLYDIAQDIRESEQVAPDLEALPIFGIEINASEQLSLFAGA